MITDSEYCGYTPHTQSFGLIRSAKFVFCFSHSAGQRIDLLIHGVDLSLYRSASSAASNGVKSNRGGRSSSFLFGPWIAELKKAVLFRFVDKFKQRDLWEQQGWRNRANTRTGRTSVILTI
jgi:hypothetical protein